MCLSKLCWLAVFIFIIIIISPPLSCYFVIFSQLWKPDRAAKGKQNKTRQGYFCYPVSLQECSVAAPARNGG